ncbi:MAG: hypothetical protein ACI8W8_000997, partial [Rhodothermales bacterium]
NAKLSQSGAWRQISYSAAENIDTSTRYEVGF